MQRNPHFFVICARNDSAARHLFEIDCNALQKFQTLPNSSYWKSFAVTLVVSLTCSLLPYSTIFKFRLFFLRLVVSGLCTVPPFFHVAVIT